MGSCNYPTNGATCLLPVVRNWIRDSEALPVMDRPSCGLSCDGTSRRKLFAMQHWPRDL